MVSLYFLSPKTLNAFYRLNSMRPTRSYLRSTPNRSKGNQKLKTMATTALLRAFRSRSLTSRVAPAYRSVSWFPFAVKNFNSTPFVSYILFQFIAMENFLIFICNGFAPWLYSTGENHNAKFNLKKSLDRYGIDYFQKPITYFLCLSNVQTISERICWGENFDYNVFYVLLKNYLPSTIQHYISIYLRNPEVTQLYAKLESFNRRKGHI